MKRIPYIILFTVLSCFTLSAKAQVVYSDVCITRSSDCVEVSFEVTAGQKSVRRGEKLILTPVLYNDSVRISLPAISVQGRRMNIVDFRRGSAAPSYVVSQAGGLHYRTQLPDAAHLENIFLQVERTLISRCNDKGLSLSTCTLTENAALVCAPAPLPTTYIPEPKPLTDYALSLPITSVADSLSRHYPFVESMDEFERSKQTPNNRLFDPNMPLNMGKGQSGSEQDEVESFIANNEKGAMQINFERGSTQIYRHYKNNNLSLVFLASVLKAIQMSDNSNIKQIIIAGFASPEGPLERNDRLAWGRANATLEFIRANSETDPSKIQLYNGSEDWRGLYQMILSSDIEGKEQLLNIIDRVPILSGREKQLMDVAGGRPFRIMTQHFFPKLRNAAYIKVYYDNPPSVADAVQDIQRAWTLIHNVDYSAALELLQKHTALCGGGVENMMGVCYIMLRDYERAREYLEQAVAKGDMQAAENLRSITAK